MDLKGEIWDLVAGTFIAVSVFTGMAFIIASAIHRDSTGNASRARRSSSISAVLSQDLRAKRDSKLTYLTAWIASFVRLPCR